MNPIQSKVFNAVTATTTAESPGKKVVRTSDGTLYTCYSATVNTFTQIFVAKSVDNGATWVDTGFPQVVGYNQACPVIATDSANNVHIAWQGADSAYANSQIKYSTNTTGTWSTWVNIQVPSTIAQVNPSIVADSNSKIHIVWSGSDAGAQEQIKYSTNTTGAWSAWVNIHATLAYIQNTPSITVDSNNKLHVTWSGKDAGNTVHFQIKYATNTSGSWSAWVNIHVSTTKSQSTPFTVVDTSNNVHVVWVGGDATHIYSQVKYSNNIGGTWAACVYINDVAGTYRQYAPSAIIDTANKLHVTWYGLDATSVTYEQLKYSTNASGTWSTWKNLTTSTVACTYPNMVAIPTGIALVYSTTSSIEYGLIVATNLTSASTVRFVIAAPTTPKIVRASDGTLYSTYSATINTFTQICVAKSTDNGLTWVDTGFPQVSGYNQAYPAIALDHNDKIHVSWHGMDSVYITKNQIKYSTNITGVWSAWLNLQPIPNYDQLAPSIAVDSNNKVHIAWHGPDASDATVTHTQIKYSTNISGTWAAWLNIAPVVGYIQLNASVAIDSSNKVHVSWQGTDVNFLAQIKYSTNKTGTWSTWINISVMDQYPQSNPSMSIDSNDKIHIVWHGGDFNAFTQIKYSTNITGSWSAWLNIIAPRLSSYHQKMAQIIIDSNDKLHVTWQGTDTTNTALNQVKYSNNTAGTWSAWENRNIPVAATAYTYPSICVAANKVYIAYTNGTASIDCTVFSENYIGAGLNTPDTSLNNGKKLVRAKDGTLYITYASIVATFTQIFVGKSTDNGLTWVDTGFPQVAGYAQLTPSVAIDDNGVLHVVWGGRDSGYTTLSQIKYSAYTSGTWSAWLNIQQIASYNQTLPSVAVDYNNKVHVTWAGMDASSTAKTQVKYSTNASGTWSAWLNIHDNIAYSQGNSAIAIDTGNKVHIVWDGPDATYTTVGQIKYSTNTTGTWSSWVNIQPITSYVQSSPSIALDSNNKVHVAWHGYDATYTTVYQIKYTTNSAGSWSAWINVQPIATYLQYTASIAIDYTSKISIVWKGADTSSPTINQVKYSVNTSGTWSPWINKTATYNVSNADPSLLISGRYLGILYTCGTSVKVLNEYDTNISASVTTVTPRYVYDEDSTIDVVASFEPEGYTGVVSNVLTFDPADSTNLGLTQYTQLDGTLRLKSILQDPMVDAGVLGAGKMYTKSFDLTAFNSISKVEVV